MQLPFLHLQQDFPHVVVSFLETDNYKGVDLEGGLNTVTNVSTALNGTYYQLFYYAFAGNYALAIGDIPTDITY